MRIKKGDTDLVIAGNDKGSTGEVREVRAKENRVLVEGVNVRWVTKKPTQQNPKGQRLQEERTIHASNVMPLDPETGKGTRKPKREA
jgi:large subunit ribosomal protein L24